MADSSTRATRPMIDEQVHTSVLREKRHWQTIAERLEPLPMLLFCPDCGKQHVDAPEPERDWTNPPHRSHLCAGCGCIWRPADFPTTGIERIRTQGKVDTWTVEDGAAAAATNPRPKILAFRFDRIRAGIAMAEGITVHALTLAEAEAAADEFLQARYPKGDSIVFDQASICFPQSNCPICHPKPDASAPPESGTVRAPAPPKALPLAIDEPSHG